MYESRFDPGWQAGVITVDALPPNSEAVVTLEILIEETDPPPTDQVAFQTPAVTAAELMPDGFTFYLYSAEEALQIKRRLEAGGPGNQIFFPDIAVSRVPGFEEVSSQDIVQSPQRRIAGTCGRDTNLERLEIVPDAAPG